LFDSRVYKADAESPLSPQLAVRPRSVDRPLAAQLVASRGHRDVNRHCRLIFSGQEDYHLTNIYDGSCGQLVSPGRDGQTRLRAPPAPSASAIPPNKETSALTSHYGCGETSFRIPGLHASPSIHAFQATALLRQKQSPSNKHMMPILVPGLMMLGSGN
jgi:hypothetical protein